MLFRAFISRIIAASTCLAMTIFYANAGNLGTLTCTLSPSDKSRFLASEAEVSCHFDPVSGPDANYSGRIQRLGVDKERLTKIVLIWSVHSEDVEFERSKLEGRYYGPIMGDNGLVSPGRPGLLSRNGEAKITLRPLTADPDIPESWGISMLELELAPIET